MATFYFTFPASSPLANAYMKVEADTHSAAREVMIGEYGFPINYAFSYVEEQFLPQIEKYNLYEVPFGYMPEDTSWLTDYSETCNPFPPIFSRQN